MLLAKHLYNKYQPVTTAAISHKLYEIARKKVGRLRFGRCLQEEG